VSLREFIAEAVCPEVFKDRENYLRLKSYTEQDRRWLGEFAEIKAYTERLASIFKDLDRAVGAPYEPTKWRIDQGGFREQLRRGEHKEGKETVKAIDDDGDEK
jgi:hypothetical protein